MGIRLVKAKEQSVTPKHVEQKQRHQPDEAQMVTAIKAWVKEFKTRKACSAKSLLAERE